MTNNDSIFTDHKIIAPRRRAAAAALEQERAEVKRLSDEREAERAAAHGPNPDDVCPPLYVPLLAECEDALHDAKRTMMGLVAPGRWDFDAMKCGHSSHRAPATAEEWAREAAAAIIACRSTTRAAVDSAAAGRVANYAADDAALQRAFAAVDALERLAKGDAEPV